MFLVLSMFELLQHQRDESTEKHGQRKHVKKIGTKKRNTGYKRKNTGITSIILKNAV